MPLKPGKSQKTISHNIGEMMHSSTFGKGKDDSTRHRMAVAAALREAREGKGRKRGARHGR